MTGMKLSSSFSTSNWVFIADVGASTYYPILKDNREYDVIFNDGTTQVTSSVNADGTVTKPVDLEKTGYTFLGWYKADVSTYEYTKVNGEIVDAKYVTVVSGSTIVTLSKEFTDTLGVGTYTIEIVSESGTAKAEFTVEEEEIVPEETVPETGDNTNIILWVVMIGVAVLGSIYLVINKKKTK